LGLGRFGFTLAVEVQKLGNEVLVVDSDEEKVNQIAQEVSHAMQGSVSSEQVLKSLNLEDYDVVVVSVAQSIETSVLSCLILKELGVKHLIAKATSRQHGKALERIGVDSVIFPERDIAVKLAQSISSSNVSLIEYFDLSPEYSIAEIYVPSFLDGLTLGEANLRSRYGLNVLVIAREKEPNFAPKAEDKLYNGDKLVVIGKKKCISNFIK